MSIVRAAVREWDAGVWTPLPVQAAIGRAAAAELAGESIREGDRRTLEAYVEENEEGRLARETFEADQDEQVAS